MYAQKDWTPETYLDQLNPEEHGFEFLTIKGANSFINYTNSPCYQNIMKDFDTLTTDEKKILFIEQVLDKFRIQWKAEMDDGRYALRTELGSRICLMDLFDESEPEPMRHNFDIQAKK